MPRIVFITVLITLCHAAQGQASSEIRYLANEAVMVTRGETKILFDPLFNESFGQYQLVPDAVRAAIFAGEPPYDGIDAIFVSHYHDDHFSPSDMLQLLRLQPQVRLYAPAQASVALQDLATAADETLMTRVTGLDLAYQDAPVTIRADNLEIGAARIPHAGWPTARTDVQNIAFRVVLDESGTVLHLGDADPRLVHFASASEYWQAREIDLALPPYWFFSSAEGNEILAKRLRALRSIGIHVPQRFSDPSSVPPALKDYELFTRPGETRAF